MLPLSVRTYICQSFRTSHHRRLLSKLNSFDKDFLKLSHIVKQHDVFFKLDNGLYRIMPSGVIALCA